MEPSTYVDEKLPKEQTNHTNNMYSPFVNSKMVRYHIVVRGEGDIDPFVFGRMIQSNDLVVEKTEMLKSGDYLITTSDVETAEKILTISELDDGVKVRAELHPSLNGIKGVIRCPALRNRTEKEILENLNIPSATRVQSKGNNVYVLTFSSAQIPKEINIGALTVRVNKFYPRPLLCRKCFVYGHAYGHCRNKAHCERCGALHGGKCGEIKCRNCGGKHIPTDQKCPVWRQEMAINRIMIDKGIPPIKARALYRKEHRKTYITTPKIETAAREEREGEAEATAGPSTKKEAPKRKTPETKQREETVTLESDSEEDCNRPATTPPAKKAKGRAKRYTK